MNCPCVKDCPDRHPGCHDNCEPYQIWKAERVKLIKTRFDYKTKEAYFYDRNYGRNFKKGEH